MTDLGDGREGVAPAHLLDLVAYTRSLNNIELVGVGTNFTCFSGQPPTFRAAKKASGIKGAACSRDRFANFPGTSSTLHLINWDNGKTAWLKTD